MRKLFYLGFCAVLAMGVGCAITNYALITDTDQLLNGDDVTYGVVNTQGKAHILEGSQVATIWSNGTDELFSMVDQTAGGDRTITTYNNFTSDYPAERPWHDDFYCNPDWQGCAIWDANDPEVGDTDIFGGKWNQNCNGSRSLSLLVSSGRFYGECGKDTLNPAIDERVALMTYGYLGTLNGEEGLWFDYDKTNSSVRVNGVNMPIPDGSLFVTGNNEMAFFADNPLIQHTLRAFGSVAPPGTIITLHGSYYGIDWERDMKVFGDANQFANRF
jgi:hypothetical protein